MARLDFLKSVKPFEASDASGFCVALGKSYNVLCLKFPCETDNIPVVMGHNCSSLVLYPEDVRPVKDDGEFNTLWNQCCREFKEFAIADHVI